MRFDITVHIERTTRVSATFVFVTRVKTRKLGTSFDFASFTGIMSLITEKTSSDKMSTATFVFWTHFNYFILSRKCWNNDMTVPSEPFDVI